MSRLLPQFPLQLVAFPNEDLNLHVFEPRYRQLVKDCKEGSTFGIPAFIEGQIMQIGTEMKLVSIEKSYPGGESDICTRAVGLYRITEFLNPFPGKLYSGASVEPMSFDLNGDPVASVEIIKRAKRLYGLLGVNKELPKDPTRFVTYNIAHTLGMKIREEYELLQLPSELERQQFMLAHLDTVIPVVEEMNRLKEKAQLNGHFKNIIPPNV